MTTPISAKPPLAVDRTQAPTCHHCPTRCAGMEIDGEVACATPLPPCPFCSSTLIERMFFAGDYWTRCRQCGVATDMRPTQAEADALWAMRAPGSADRAVRRIWEIVRGNLTPNKKVDAIAVLLDGGNAAKLESEYNLVPILGPCQLT